MEYLSALQAASYTHPLKPSLFELISEGQLNNLLPPTCRYLLALLTHRHPRYLLRILNSFDEVYALLSLVVEKYYLETFGAGFTENFYGLKRERVLRLRGGELKRTALAVPELARKHVSIQSSRRDVWRNLMVMVGVPYLKRKLDEAYDVHIAPSASLITSGPQYIDRDALPPNATPRQRLLWYYKWFLRKVYPSVNAAYHFSIMAFSVAYLFDGTKYSSPLLWLIGTRMRRLDQLDYRVFDLAAKTSRGGADSNLGWRSILDRRLLYPRLLASLKILLPASMVGLRFLEWWHASDFSRQLGRKAAEGIDLPPPIVTGMDAQESLPTKSPALESSPTSEKKKSSPPISSTSMLPILTVPQPPTSDLCPICLHPVSNPTACQTGYVFDYRCIFQWIQGTHQRQLDWMKGTRGSEWEDETDEQRQDQDEADTEEKSTSREGKWESGQGRCAVTGRRVLGGTNGLRRIVI